MFRRFTPALFALLPLVACTVPAEDPADLVLRNGVVVTVDDENPEATAVAITGDRIVAVGSDRDIGAYIGSGTEVIDLDGRLAVPGFIESHGHYMSLGQSKMILDLQDVTSWDEIVSMVSSVASDAPAGEWILGRGWHQEKWTETPEGSVEGVPTHTSLSAVSPNNPVLLGHASGHAAFANARAMELAGIDRTTADPAGGTIVRDASGNATGLLRETAQRLVSGVRDEHNARRSDAELRADAIRAVQLAGEEALSHGVTSFHDAGSDFATIDLFRELADQGELPVRLYVMVRRESNEAMAARLADYRMVNHGNGFLTVRSIKRQIDGALGSHGAWLLEPYEDLETEGLVLETVEDITRTAEIAVDAGFQVNAHAIGDRANRELLDLFERVWREKGVDGRELRWRIEHAQHIHPDDIPRFGELGIVAAMQGIHATSDAPWVFRRLGDERAESGAYMWRALMENGVVIANGTDVPVERIDPIASFHASVSRRTADGEVFFAAQRMTREEALRSYTINGAYAAFAEDVKGSITPGKYADLVVLSRNIMTVPEEEIPGTTVVYTILGGAVRYAADGN